MAVVKLVATLSSSGRRAVVVGGVADRYASELARAGQSNRRRAGTGSDSSECATRPPLWPAGVAEGNRATFGPRVGLSSHGSPAKGGPKSKCLARVKIARTSAGLPSLTISDLSRFPSPPLSVPRFPSPLSRFPSPLSVPDLVGALGAGPRPEGVGRPAAWWRTSHDVLARLMFSSRADSFSPANRLHPHYQKSQPKERAGNNFPEFSQSRLSCGKVS